MIARSSARFRVCRCFSAQVSHLVWSGTVGFGQSLQMPSFLASSRLAWAMRRRSSLRSGVWRLFRSYFRRFSSLASTCAGVGSTRGLGVLGVRSFGTTFLGGFLTFGFCGGFQVGGLLFLFFWTDRSMVYWKSCLSAWCIPAPAGEPVQATIPPMVIQVYPRACGGTTAFSAISG